MTESLAQLSKGALSDLADVFAAMPEDALDRLIEEIVKARRIVVFGLGREGLQMRGFAMRLFHMGRDVAVWGDMTTPALGPGDLFIASAGPGDLPTAHTLVDIAREAGARTALVTAQPKGGLAAHVDVVTFIPAQTMANDQGGKLSVLPMGSLFETAQMIAFELVILKLKPRFNRVRRPCARGTPISSDRVVRYPASFHAFTNACAARRTSSTLAPGLYSAEPIPKPLAPARR
jgi:6-phospho-3-hexuloisomerase